MIKKRTRPQPRVRERDSSPEDDAVPENEEEEKLPYVVPKPLVTDPDKTVRVLVWQN